MNNTKTKTKSYLFAAIGFLLTLALDQWTKYLASTILRRLESFSLISGVFELRYLENRGAAFGIMQNRQIVFVVGGIIILAFWLVNDENVIIFIENIQRNIFRLNIKWFRVRDLKNDSIPCC